MTMILSYLDSKAEDSSFILRRGSSNVFLGIDSQLREKGVKDRREFYGLDQEMVYIMFIHISLSN